MKYLFINVPGRTFSLIYSVFLERPGSFQNHRHRIKTQNRLQRQSKHIFVILFVLYSSQNMPKYFVLFCKQMFTGVCCYLNGSKSEVTVLCWVLPAKGLSWRQQNVKQVFKQVFKSIFVLWGSQQRELAGTRSGLFTQGLLFRLRKGSEITQAKNKTSGEKKRPHAIINILEESWFGVGTV